MKKLTIPSLFISVLVLGLLIPFNQLVSAACAANTANKGSATGSFTIPTTGTYRVWSRIQPDSATPANNSYTLEIDGTTCNVTVGDATISSGQWTWVDYKDGNTATKINLALTAGTHTYAVYGREDNVLLDRVIFASDTSCVPTGDGSNCVALPADTTPPVISSVASSAINTTSATVSWTTDEPSTTQVKYGTTTSYGSTTTLNSSMVTSHSVNLSGLSPSTTYHYQVVSSDAASNQGQSADATFTTTATTPPPDTTPPVISSVSSSAITSTSATVTWTTNETASTQVKYGTTTSYGSTTTLNPALVINHSAALSGLSPSTTYHYQVVSKDAAANQAQSADATFTTAASGGQADTTPPTVSFSYPGVGTLPANGIVTTVSAIIFQPSASDNVGLSSQTYTVNGQPVTLTSGTYTTAALNDDYIFNAVVKDTSNLTTTLNQTVKLRYPDINRDSKVNTLDVLTVLRQFNATNQKGYDFNGDGVVSTYDVLFILRKWNP